MSKWDPFSYVNEDKQTLLVDRHGKPILVRQPRPVGFRPPKPEPDKPPRHLGGDWSTGPIGPPPGEDD